MNRILSRMGFSAGLLLIGGMGLAASSDSITATSGSPEHPSAPVKRLQIDLDKAVDVVLPHIGKDLTPVPFTTPDGLKGWVVRIPQGKAIATPAYSHGKLFLGGGLGSAQFYAFDAATGEKVWQVGTGDDDGPTPAVAEDGYVVFNTHSCTLFATDEKTGKIVWQDKLGSTLMTQPAISRGQVYSAYPSDGRANSPYVLVCMDLKTGRHVWEQGIPADVMSAPILDDDKLYVTCLDGTSCCLHSYTGNILWTKENASNSAPLGGDGQVLLTGATGEKGAGVRLLDPQKGTDSDAASGKSPAASSVPVTGDRSEEGIWSYQGPRAAFYNGHYYNAPGRLLNSISAADGRLIWQATVKGVGIDGASQVFSPPALGHRNIYLCSAQGHFVAVSQRTGRVQFNYAFKQPITFQPALADGNMYVGTRNGLLICLKTGDKDADGWTAWGGNAQHDKKN